MGALGQNSGNVSTAENTVDENYNRSLPDNLQSSVLVKPHISQTIMTTESIAKLTQKEAILNKRFMDPGKSGFKYQNFAVQQAKHSSALETPKRSRVELDDSM